jgi:hypothetical protein
MRSACIIVLVTLAGSAAWTQEQTARDAVVARAKTLELDTPYVPPPGDPLEHHAAGYAKIVCSAVSSAVSNRHLHPRISATSSRRTTSARSWARRRSIARHAPSR